MRLWQRDIPFDPAALDEIVTPALVVVPSRIDGNVAAVIERVGGANRWRPHIKTVKMALAIEVLRRQGVRNFKCATLPELSLLCECGVEDVLLSHFQLRANAVLLRSIAESFPETSVSVLVDDPVQLRDLRGAPVAAFIDVDVGMHRTGLSMNRLDSLRRLAADVVNSGIALRGLHAYDGHLGARPNAERAGIARAVYARLVNTTQSLVAGGLSIAEVVTSGSPTFAHAVDFEPLSAGPWTHRVSPGTVVLADGRSLAQTAEEVDLHPAAFVLSRVVSHPTDDIVTCDAGHKALAVDVGTPHCAVVGHPGLEPLAPSEEHLPFRVVDGEAPRLGTLLALLPEHVCPTVNLHDYAVLVEDGVLTGVEPVTARGYAIQSANGASPRHHDCRELQ